MSILVDKNTRVIVPGLTGKTGTFHSEQAHRLRHQDGRRRVARKGGRRSHLGLPIFDTVAEAQAPRPAPTPRVIYVPPPGAADAMLEAIDAEIPLIVAITEGIPVLDMVQGQARAGGLEIAAASARIAPAC